MKVLNKLLSILLCLVLLTGLCAPAALAAEENTVIRIYTVNDFIQFAKQCSLDSWSQDKTVILERNIDLSLTQFQPIPTFGGTFDGQGNTISGLNLRTNGEVQGLFRYIQQTGVVKNLTVDGSLIPSDYKEIMGGIVGINSGTITQCMFRGTLRGKSSVGGIAGINNPSGQIINCSFTGTIIGEHYVGGITGQNLGSIVRCRNNGDVNTTEVKATIDPEDLDLEHLNSTANMPASTDIGGIAGFSSGTIQSCHNTGNVGYPHVGYNVGGIVGRHNGYLGNCTNKGLIQGRKDVGGIVGQMEPQLTLKYDQSALDQIWVELDTLEQLIDVFLEDTSTAADQLTGKIQGVSDSALAVKDAVADLSSSMADWVDGNISHINDASARISWAMERMVPVFDAVELAMDQIELAFEFLSDGLDETSLAARYGAQAAEDMTLAMDDLQNAIIAASLSLNKLRSAMDEITQGLGNSEAAKQSIKTMSDAMSDFTTAFGGISNALGDIYDAMDRVYDWIQTDPDWIALRDGVDQLRHAFDGVFSALSEIGKTLEALADDPELQNTLVTLSDAVQDLLESISNLAPALEDFFSVYEQFRAGNTDEALDALEQAVQDLNATLDDVDVKTGELSDALASIRDSELLQDYTSVLDGHLSDLNSSIQQVQAAVNAINEALDDLDQSNQLSEEIAVVRTALADIVRYLDEISDAANSFSRALNVLIQNLSPEDLENAWNELKAGVSALESAAYSLVLSAGHLNDVFQSLSDAANVLADGLDRFSHAGRSMADAFASLEQAAAEAGGILEELTAMPPIQFDLLEGSVTDEGDALNSAADDLFASFNSLNSVLRSQANHLSDDLQAINAQIGEITDLLQRFQQEQTNKDIEDLLDDVSDQAANDSMSNGKISVCENLGAVLGDLNVAGIVGSVAIEYDFDPEDDLTVSGSRSIDAAFLTRGVIHGCINRGVITAKKNAAGGIVGMMDLGYAAACQSYGAVTSTAGKYVGGIAGQSYGGIADCWAKCTLSGGGYVGGIAGLGSLIQNCRTLIDTKPGVPFTGAIAGQMDENSTLTGNLFVHHTLAGVDGVSYEGAAQPASYEQLIELEGLPAEFTQFSLTFTADGKTVVVIPFQYGDSLTELPEIPEKAAHSACWPEMDLSFLYFSRTLEAQYTPYDTALSDGQNLPSYLVDGSFSPDAEIAVTQSEVTWVDEKDNVLQIPVYTVTVTDPKAEQVFFTLHWRLPEDGEYDLWVLKGYEWVMQEYIPDGSYLLLDCSEGQLTFCMTPQAQPPLLLMGAILLAVIVLAIIIISLICRANRKKKQLVALITGE